MTKRLRFHPPYGADTFILVCAMLLPVTTAVAQQATNIAAIRKTTPLSAIDRQTLSRWVDDQLGQLAASQAPQTDGPKFLAALMEHHRAGDATPAFREGLARCLVENFTKREAAPTSAPNGTPIIYPSVYPLLAMRRFGDPSAFECYRKALSDPSAAVRLAGIDGLLSIRDRTNAQQWTTLLADLKKLGSAETDPVVFTRCVRLLAINDAQRAQAVLPVLLGIMETRLPALEQKRQWVCPGDGEAAAWIGARAVNNNNAQQRTAIARVVARVLADAVHAYTTMSPSDLQKEILERVVQAAEPQLKAMTAGRPQPDVTAAMLAGGAAQAAKMSAEVEKWIGSNGLLTQPPFSLPAGLGIQRPTTSSAPG